MEIVMIGTSTLLLTNHRNFFSVKPHCLQFRQVQEGTNIDVRRGETNDDLYKTSAASYFPDTKVCGLCGSMSKC